MDLAFNAGDLSFGSLKFNLGTRSLVFYAALVRSWEFFGGEEFVLVALDFFSTDRIANELLTDALLAN